MAIQSPFFTKRDSEVAASRPAQAPAAGRVLANGVTPVHPLYPAGAPASSSGVTTADAPSPAVASQTEGGSKLTVGPNIKLKGVEITDCDTLVVEGLVEATMDSRLMLIAPTGAFKGAAQIDIAEVRGLFEGTLTVRQKLVIHSTGKVTGTVRYGTLVVEEGGQLAGDIASGAAVGAVAGKPALVTKAPLQAA